MHDLFCGSCKKSQAKFVTKLGWCFNFEGMLRHEDITSIELKRLIRTKKILFAGNKNLKIYGTLRCGSGKRMKISNRVFFKNEEEAITLGYRPCKNCLLRR
ncbi:MAG: Ada metal-binding domain-containing protein [Bacteroidota bacterium]